jgi:hypothetical protein
MENYPMNDHPLLHRLNLSSFRALMIWTITYAINHRDEVNPDTLARMRQGTPAERQAASMISVFMP